MKLSGVFAVTWKVVEYRRQVLALYLCGGRSISNLKDRAKWTKQGKLN
jgi:hypothetical protein